MKWPRMKAGRPPTETELIVLRRVAVRGTPYEHGGTRVESQAFSRLKQLGYARYDDDNGNYVCTPEGRKFL
jgi:hypothetical protein